MKKTGLLAGLIVLLVAGCGVPKKKYNAQLELAKRLQEQLAAAQSQNGNLNKKVTALESMMAGLQSKIKEAENDAVRLSHRFRAKLQATQKELEELAKARREAEQRNKMLRELTAKFRKLIDAGTLSITIIHGRMVLKLKSAVLFASGRAHLRKAGQNTLKAIAAVLKTINGKHFQVAGHTDDKPIHRSKFRNNWWLSSARAVQVVDFLQKQGVPPQNLSAAGFSQYQPVSSNATGAGRKQNRRIEITLLPSIPRQLLQGK
ncbi:MAG: OmpA family protein [Deltaproteobacteria bacterium]|nr:OmpA family protein [Deltaproteobacteria bacterium]